MDKIDIPALRRVAEVATPGDWVAKSGTSSCPECDDVDCWSEVTSADKEMDCYLKESDRHEQNAAHISAFQPRVSLQLLALIEALEAVTANIRMNLQGDIKALTAEQARWKLGIIRKLLGDDA